MRGTVIFGHVQYTIYDILVPYIIKKIKNVKQKHSKCSYVNTVFKYDYICYNKGFVYMHVITRHIHAIS